MDATYDTMERKFRRKKYENKIFYLKYPYLFRSRRINEYRIRGYCKRGCKYSPQILVNMFLHGQRNGWGKIIRGGKFVVFLENFETIRLIEFSLPRKL